MYEDCEPLEPVASVRVGLMFSDPRIKGVL